MSNDYKWLQGLDLDVEFGYLDPTAAAPRRHNPRVVLNTDESSVLRTVREELGNCESFLFSVAFVTRGRSRCLQELDRLPGEGNRGAIVTSDYLAFNSPEAFEELPQPPSTRRRRPHPSCPGVPPQGIRVHEC